MYDELNLCQRGFPIITVEGSDSGRMIYGILHEDGSKMPVSFEFSRIGEYSEGYWLVSMDKKNGYMDSLGKLVIPFTYDIAYSFYNGVAIVAMVDYRLYPDIGLMGLIDKKGKAITPLKYSEISGSLETGLYTVHVKKKVGTISNTGIEYFKN